MSRRASIFILAAVAVLFFAGMAELLRMRFSRGDVYPVYSSYRADPLGTRALYESIEIVPGMRVRRWLRDAEKLPKDMRATIVFAGMEREQWESASESDAARLDALVRDGSRLVVTFTAGFEERELKRWRRSNHDSDDDDSGTFDFLAPPARLDAHRGKKTFPKERAGKSEPPDDDKKDGRKKTKAKPADLGKKWGATIGVRQIEPDKEGRLPFALRAADAAAPATLPARLEWLSEYYFETHADSGENAEHVDAWRTLYARENRPVLIERKLGAGSIVLASDSFFLSNEALQRARATALLAWLAGASGIRGGLVVFDENHLGMAEDAGVAALARRYGLGGAACMFALLAGLWIWRRMALFAPPPGESEEPETGYEPTAGLEALLRRTVPRAQLTAVAVAEWKKTARADDIVRVDRALGGLDKNAPPETAWRVAKEALRKR